MEKKQAVSVLAGLAVAAVFLVLTFRGLDINQFRNHLADISPVNLVVLSLISLVALLSRGLRWWFLLPRPLRKQDLVATQRATVISYGVNNVASRIGELLRIVVFVRDSGRSFGSVASTVVVDRILFDFVAFACFFSFAIYGFREQVTAMFPQLEAAFQV